MLILAFGFNASWPTGLVTTVSVAAAFAGMGMLVGGRLFARHRPAKSANRPMSSPLRDIGKALDAEAAPTPAVASGAEHRGSIRTCGTWVKVVLTENQPGSRLLEGHVVDHTPNGVGIMLFEPLTVGQSYKIRHAKAPGEVPWAHLEVRSCQQLDRQVWKAGCHVEDVTLWDTLMRYS
jgi:hypothetical protein